MFDLTRNAKDAAYVLIGLGVVGYQRAQARAEELGKRAEAQRTQLDQQVDRGPHPGSTQLAKLTQDQTRFTPVREVLETRLDTFQAALPERAKDLVTQARGKPRPSCPPQGHPRLNPRLGAARASARTSARVTSSGISGIQPVASRRRDGRPDHRDVDGRTSAGSVSSLRSAPASFSSRPASSSTPTSVPEHTL